MPTFGSPQPPRFPARIFTWFYDRKFGCGWSRKGQEGHARFVADFLWVREIYPNEDYSKKELIV